MAAPTRPTARPTPTIPPCPRCQSEVESITANSGWIQHSPLGTRVGTYPDMPPNDHDARMDPCPEFTRYQLEPCGDVLYPNEFEEWKP